jgi:hypothetical protein
LSTTPSPLMSSGAVKTVAFGFANPEKALSRASIVKLDPLYTSTIDLPPTPAPTNRLGT